MSRSEKKGTRRKAYSAQKVVRRSPSAGPAMTALISVLRNLELEANKLYDRANKLYKAALLTRCYVQHFLSPYIDSEVNHKRHFIKIPFIKAA